MAAARPAGAAGGTVLHSRRVGAEETLQQWGFSIQQEKEAVLILARKEEKLAVVLGTEGEGLRMVRDGVHTDLLNSEK